MIEIFEMVEMIEIIGTSGIGWRRKSLTPKKIECCSRQHQPFHHTQAA